MIDILRSAYFSPMRRIIILGIVLLVWSCEKSTTPEDIEPIQNPQFYFIQEQNQLYFAVHMESSSDNGRLDSVSVWWFGSDTLQSPDTISLNDLGNKGDIIAADDIYSRKESNSTAVLKNAITITDTGIVYIRYIGHYQRGLLQTLGSFQLGNLRPVILNVDAPDIMIRPDSTGWYSVDTLKVTVRDPNGLSDIQSCYLLFQKPDSSFANGGRPILLYDDGNINEMLFLWDEKADDGVFSRFITIGAENPLGTYYAYFYVKDNHNLYASTVVETLVVIE